MVQQKNVRKDSRLQRQIEELQKRMDAMEDILDNAKEVLSVEEAARFMDIARSSLYKMTSDRAKRQDDLLRESGHSGMDKEEPRNASHVR